MDKMRVLKSLLILSVVSSPAAYAAKGDQTISVGYAHVNGGFARDAYSENIADYESRLKNSPTENSFHTTRIVKKIRKVFLYAIATNLTIPGE